MVNQQGEQLDLASDNVIAAEGNVSQARTNLATSEKVRLFLLFFFFVCLLLVRATVDEFVSQEGDYSDNHNRGGSGADCRPGRRPLQALQDVLTLNIFAHI
jgi:hypothetical protein